MGDMADMVNDDFPADEDGDWREDAEDRHREEVCCFCGGLFIGAEEPPKHGKNVPRSPEFPVGLRGVRERTEEEVRALLAAKQSGEDDK